jgi:hypothetical protein
LKKKSNPLFLAFTSRFLINFTAETTALELTTYLTFLGLVIVFLNFEALFRFSTSGLTLPNEKTLWS